MSHEFGPMPEPVQLGKHLPTGYVIWGYNADHMRAYALAYAMAEVAKAVEAERERCAALCDARKAQELAYDRTSEAMAADDCSRAIRRATPTTTAQNPPAPAPQQAP